jgi:hypothetical protein
MLPLLAQGNNFNAANGNLPPGFLAVMLVVVGVVVLVAIVIAIFFLLTLSKALSRCSPDNRTMEPAMVWLNLIPCLNIVWQFVTVIRVSESLDNEFYARGYDRGDDYGKNIGISYCVLNLMGWIPYLGVVFSLAGLVCFILYWVKIAGFSKQLASAGDYDDYDDRPRRKRRKREYDDDDADESDEDRYSRKKW